MGAFGAFASPFQYARPIQAPSPMEYAAQYQQLQALAQGRQLREQQIALGQQEQQANALKIQEVQQQQRDQQLLTKAYIDSGGDRDKFRTLAGNSGARWSAINAADEGLLKHDAEVQAYNKGQLDNYEKTNGAIRDASETLLAITDPAQREAAYQQMRPRLAKLGITDLPANLPQGDDWLNVHRTWGASAEARAKQIKEQQEAKSAALKFSGDTRAAAAKELGGVMDLNTGQVTDRPGYDALAAKPEYKGIFPPLPDAGFNQRFYATNVIPGEKLPEWQAQQRLAQIPREEWMNRTAQLIPAQTTIDGKTYDTSRLQETTMGLVRDALDRRDYKGADTIIKDAAKSIGATEQAVRTAQATAPIKISVAGAEAAARAPQVTDAALDLMAENLIQGKPVSMRNPVLYAKANNRAAELLQQRGMTAQAMVMQQNAAKASTQALNALTKQYELLKPFAQMADKNADLLEKRMAEVSDLGASVLNTPLRNLEGKFGSTKVAALRAALLPVQADFGRILSSPAGSAAVHVDAQNDMRKAMNEGATVGQIKAALDVFRQDAKNRDDRYKAAVQDLTQRTVVGGGTQQTGGTQSGGGGADTSEKKRARYNPATGMIER